LERAITKVQVVLLIVILLVGAVGAYYVAQKALSKNGGTLTPTPAPSTSPTTTPTSTSVNAGILTVVSVSIIQPYNPGGPTIEVILQNNSTNPVVSLQAVLPLSGHNYTYVFSGVSSSNPLFPKQNTSQTETLPEAGFEASQTYPMKILGTLQNGSSFNFTVPVTIVQSQTSNQPVAYGESGSLELTMTLNKTIYYLSEPVNLTLTITNISVYTINFTDTGLNFDFQVYNDTNNLVYQWSNFRAIPQFISIVPLQAGASISANFTWLQTYNFNAQVQGELIPPGTYYIVGETGPTYGIQTTLIQLTIVEEP